MRPTTGITFRSCASGPASATGHPHELRHSAASLMLAAHTDPKVVSEVLGHSSIRITMDVYGHLLEGATRDATAAVAGLLAGDIR
ncbi:MAG: tyrosine-type recombinase/integrase [Acidimicrobiales bacterium]